MYTIMPIVYSPYSFHNCPSFYEKKKKKCITHPSKKREIPKKVIFLKRSPRVGFTLAISYFTTSNLP